MLVRQILVDRILHQPCANAHRNTDAANDLVKSKVAEKQKKIDALYGNLSAGVLSPEVLAEIDNQIVTLRQEIETLETMEPPHDFTAPEIRTCCNPYEKPRMAWVAARNNVRSRANEIVLSELIYN